MANKATVLYPMRSMIKLKKMMLSANGHMPAPLMAPFCDSERLKVVCNSPIVLARTPKTNEVATRAMKHAQNSLISALPESDWLIECACWEMRLLGNVAGSGAQCRSDNRAAPHYLG